MRNQIPKKLISILLASVLTLSQPFGVLATELQKITETTETVSAELQTSTEQDDAKELVVNTDNTDKTAVTNEEPEILSDKNEENAEPEAPDNTPDSDLGAEIDKEAENAVDNSDAEDQTEDAELSATSLTQMTEDSVVTISGDMPEDAYFTVEPVEYVTDLETVMNENDEESYTYTVSKAYDINLYDGNGEAFQPVEYDSTVTVKIQSADLEDLGEKNVYRIEEDEQTTEIEVIDQTDNSVTFEAEHFTVYVVGKTTVDTGTLSTVFTKKYNGITWSLYEDGTLVATGSGSAYARPAATGVYPNGIAATLQANESLVRTVILDCTLYKNCSELFQGYLLKSSVEYHYFQNLTTVVKGPNFNSSYVTNTSKMFANCPNLTSIDLSGWNTAKVTNMSGMFTNCASITSLDLSSFSTNIVTDMSTMFAGCENLTSLNDIAGWNTVKVTNMSGMFTDCKALTSLDLSGWSTSVVTNMSNMFSGCENLASLGNVASWNPVKTTNMSGMFTSCKALTSLNLSGWNTAIVTNMTGTFEACENLTTLDLSGWSFVKVTSYGQFLDNCPSLNIIKAPKTITSSQSIILPEKEGCAWYLDDIEPELETDTKTVYEQMIKGVTNVTHKYIRSDAEGFSLVVITTTLLPGTDFNEAIKKLVNSSARYNIIDTTITAIKFVETSFTSSTKVSVTGSEPVYARLNGSEVDLYTGADIVFINTNAAYMFCKFKGLLSFNGSDWDTSNVTDMNHMFDWCESLTTLDLSDWNTSNVTNMSDMFDWCESLTTLDLSDWNTSNVTDISYMFYSCESLATLDLSDWDTSNVTSMTRIFLGDYSFIFIDLSNWDLSNATDVDISFAGCSNFQNFKAPKTILSGSISLPYGQWFLDDNEDLRADGIEKYSNCIVPSTNKTHNYVRSDMDGFIAPTTFDTGSVFNKKIKALVDSSATAETIDTTITAIKFVETPFTSTTNVAKTTDIPIYARLNGTEVELYCSSDWIYLPNSCQQMFYNLKKLKHLDLSGLNTPKTTIMIAMFNDCESLTSLDLSNWDTTKVTNMARMFKNCNKLTSISGISDWNTLNVINMTDMFNGCGSLTSLDLSGWDISNATSINSILTGCNSLQTIRAPKTMLSAQTITLPAKTGHKWYIDDDKNLEADSNTTYTSTIVPVADESHNYIRSDIEGFTSYAPPVATITYINGANTIHEDTVNVGDTYTLIQTMPAQANKRFVGWQYNSTRYNSGAEFGVVNENITFTAEFVDTVTVTYKYTDRRTWTTVTYKTETVDKGTDYIITTEIPEYDGQTDDDSWHSIFKKWGTGSYSSWGYAPGETYGVIYNDLILYALYEEPVDRPMPIMLDSLILDNVGESKRMPPIETTFGTPMEYVVTSADEIDVYSYDATEVYNKYKDDFSTDIPSFSMPGEYAVLMKIQGANGLYDAHGLVICPPLLTAYFEIADEYQNGISLGDALDAQYIHPEKANDIVKVYNAETNEQIAPVTIEVLKAPFNVEEIAEGFGGIDSFNELFPYCQNAEKAIAFTVTNSEWTFVDENILPFLGGIGKFNLIILPALPETFTISANNVEKKEGEDDPELTYEATGSFVSCIKVLATIDKDWYHEELDTVLHMSGSDFFKLLESSELENAPLISLEREAGETPGEYVITPSFTAMGAEAFTNISNSYGINYSPTIEPGTFTISSPSSYIVTMPATLSLESENNKDFINTANINVQITSSDPRYHVHVVPDTTVALKNANQSKTAIMNVAIDCNDFTYRTTGMNGNNGVYSMDTGLTINGEISDPDSYRGILQFTMTSGTE